MAEQYRRSSDISTTSACLEIEELIKLEDDPKQRAFLVVLSSINRSLTENTTTTRSISVRLEQHIEASEERHNAFLAHAKVEEDHKNQIKGSTKVIIWVLGIAQVLILGGASLLWTEIKTVNTFINETNTENALIQQRIKTLDDRISVLYEDRKVIKFKSQK